MNAATSYRASLYGLDRLPASNPRRRQANNNNYYNNNDDGNAPAMPPLRRANNGFYPDGPQESQTRSFVPVDWLDSKSIRAERERDDGESGVWDVPWEPEPEAHSVRAQAWRLVTIYPYRDAIWIVKVLLLLGGSFMAISASLGLTAQLNPPPAGKVPTAWDAAMAAATLATSDVGLVLLLLAGSLALVATLNAHRSATIPVDPVVLDEKKTVLEDGTRLEPPPAYKPALLGSASWVWTPTREDLRGLWAKLPFRAALVNWAGLFLFNVTVVTSLPGVLDPGNFRQIQLGLHVPLALGFLLLVVANGMLLLWLQERWYKPRPTAAWLSTFLAVVASASLTLSPFYQDGADLFDAAVATFVGRWVFFVAILIGFYDLMAFHPNAWAGTALGLKRRRSK